MRDTIVIAGSIAQKPWQGGHTWVFLQYLLGFQKLGWDVLFIDQLDSAVCRNEKGEHCSVEESSNLDYFIRVMQEFGLNGSFSLICDGGRRSIGLQRSTVLERVSRGAMLLNVMGFLRDREILDCSPKRVFLDIDPGFGQMWQELGLCKMFIDHHCYVTIGENIGKPGCSVPTCGIEWITTKQPVVLDHWKSGEFACNGPFTSVASWRGAYGPVTFQEKTYGLRVHEFRKFAILPNSAHDSFEVAIQMHPADRADRHLLKKGGWTLAEPRTVAADPCQYGSYIRRSGAEFMVAKNMYVESQSGWFSDRSICYLASGKPVLAQNTGLDSIYPSGHGLLTFRTSDEAIAGVHAIRRDYTAHSRAAARIVAEFFDSDKVLGSLMQKVGVI